MSMINTPLSLEDSSHGGLGPIGDPVEEAQLAKVTDGAAGDHPGRHRQDQADDAAHEPAQRGHDEDHQGMDVESLAHHHGLDEVLQQEVGGEHGDEHDHTLVDSALTKAMITASPPPRKAPM
jgi:hypothetical protein